MKTPIRLLITVPAVGSVYGGPSKSVLELASALGSQGILVDVVATNANGRSKLDLPADIWLDEKGYRIKYFPCSIWGGSVWSTRLASWVYHNIRNYDILHINIIFNPINLPFYLACFLWKIPYLIAPRGMLEPWALNYKAWKKRSYYKLLELPALNGASGIHTLATSEAEKIRSLCLKTSVFTVPNGIHKRDFQKLVDSDVFYQAFPALKNKKFILFLGRLDPKKGFDLLASAFSRVVAKYPDIHLVVAGPDNIGFLTTIKKYFEDAQCLSSVTFTGLLEGNLKLSALTAASLYVAPSYSEGFSMSVLEAMASGLPCVITTGCNFPEAAECNAAQIVSPDAEEVSKAILRFLDDTAFAARTGTLARELVLGKYTWDSVAQKLLFVFDEIVSSCE